ncbi:MAG: DNA polymerase ligase N-terminal domain-containing protein [Gemmatimonadaceae bacterium]
MAKRRGALKSYRRRRDFTVTAEPSGSVQSGSRRGSLQFVVQKHDASRLHFDLRLELDAVMKSWAVPKGASLDPSVKRLAMEVEDHPMEYNNFEGTIPQGEYGGGTVMIWDRGTYLPTPGSETSDIATLRDGFASGKVDITLHGERLRGSFALVRMRRPDVKPQWLLIKHFDDFAQPGYDVVAEEMTSVVTGRTMQQIAGEMPGETTAQRRKAGTSEPATPTGDGRKRKVTMKSGTTARRKTAARRRKVDDE